ncbi:MAG: glycerol-3-phosphate 1-O-acyltransferase PlsY [Patescibacteria group bacterium]
MSVLISVLIIVSAYLLGSIIISPALGRTKGIDIRRRGSGNPGATNTFRVLGWKMGLLELLFDIIKGIVPVWASYALGRQPWELVAVGTAVIIGHLFPVFGNFKGGKGVATATGVLIVLSPLGLGIALLIFVATYIATHYVSLASILATATIVASQIFKASAWDFANEPVTIWSLVLLAIILVTHRQNIIRLLAGQETKTYLFKKG